MTTRGCRVAVSAVLIPSLVGLLLQSGCKEDDKRPPGGTITGTVSRPDGTPVERAVVMLDGVGLQCTTDEQGRYSLGPLPAGAYNVVATFPGLRDGTRFNVSVAAGRRVEHLDFKLENDPNYVSDSIKIERAKPKPGSILRAGTRVRFEIIARCRVVNAAYAKVKFTAQDEKERPLIRYPADYTLTTGERFVPFVRSIRVPNRVRGKLFIAAVMLPGGDATHPLIDYVSYEVRKYEDAVSLRRVELKPTDKKDRHRVTLAVDVGYTLDLLTEATLRLTVKVAYPDEKAVDLLKEASRKVKKAELASGTHVFTLPLVLPPNAGSLLVRAELVSSSSGDVVDYAYHNPIPVPWEIGGPMVILGEQEKEETK